MRSATRMFVLVLVLVCTVRGADPLPSWNEGVAKKAVVGFVHAATDQASSKFVPPEERIATFDNDGTLWVEQPLYPQITFAIERVTEMATQHPEWKEQEPFKAVLAHDREAIAGFNIQDFEKIIAATHGKVTVASFQDEVKDWLATAKHPRFQRPYTELVYQPMLELLQYLRANGFKTYIVTGGGQDFVRVFADRIYGIPPEQVVGSAGKVKFEYAKDGKPVLVKLPEVVLINDKAGKPEGINLIIGRRPLAAFGNSAGDQQMLEYTQAGDGVRLMMLVHHDDADREYAYGPDSKVGRFPEELMAETRDRGWIVISMKKDWKVIFPSEKPKSGDLPHQ